MDKRNFNAIEDNYEYKFARMIIVAKGSGSEWSYVDGLGARKKSSVLELKGLKVGRYAVITMADWTDNCYNLTLAYYGTAKASFQRIKYESQPNFIGAALMGEAFARGSSLMGPDSSIKQKRLVMEKEQLVVVAVKNESSTECSYRYALDGPEKAQLQIMTISGIAGGQTLKQLQRQEILDLKDMKGMDCVQKQLKAGEAVAIVFKSLVG